MTIVFNSILIALFLILIHVIAVTIFIRKYNYVAPILIHAISAIAMLIILTATTLLNVSFDLWLAFSLLAFGVSAFLFIFGAVYKSLSLRLLMTTYSMNGQASFVSLDDKVTYPNFSDRANLLCAMGMAIKIGEEYQITTKGQKIAAQINYLRKLFKVSTIGLY